MSTTARARLSTGSAAQSRSGVLFILLVVGLALRILFINAEGFRNDVASFEAWSLTLGHYPLDQFYPKTSFADYPPGYFYVLWLVGHIYVPLFSHADPSYSILKIAVKLPGILMDLADAVLIYAIVRRFASPTWATVCAGTFVLNPVTIFISAYWGQVDSVAAGFMLGAVALVLYSEQWSPRYATLAIVGAWLSLAYSVLVKPQAAIVGLLLLAYPFATGDANVRARRLAATGYGLLAALVFADLLALPFVPDRGPGGAFIWLFQRYQFGSSVYPYTTVNAFNLYAVFRSFWQPDSSPITLGPLSLGTIGAWGVVLVGAATLLIIGRYLQRRDDASFLEAAMLLTFAFFILATRMHERYIFNAFTLLIVLMPLARRFVNATAVVSVTFLINLVYSLSYLNVVEHRVPGINAADMWPVTHVLSAFNVAAFFMLGYIFLGGVVEGFEGFEGLSVRTGSGLGVMRGWFSPLEGLTSFLRLDYVLAAGFALLSFGLCVWWYWIPGEKIFDEIYYARSGEEYLKHIEQFEWTHPPLTKLIITLSMALFGGLHGLGDTAVGWRFLNVIVGAIMVFVIYAFAKRLLGSTLFAAITAGMLTFDGFHFVQSRIATPEITVAFFSLLTLYAFYRYWIAAQVRVVDIIPQRFGWQAAAIVAVGAAIGAAGMTLVHPGTMGSGVGLAKGAVFLYVTAAFYLAARLLLPRYLPRSGSEASYAEGSRVIADDGGGTAIYPSDGGIIADKKTTRLGPLTQATKSSEYVLTDGELQLTYARSGAMRYAAPGGEAQFSPEGTMATPVATLTKDDGPFWLGILFLCAAALADSKWNGLFDFWVIWFIVAFVIAQRWLKWPAVFGNPRGFPIDVVVVGMCFVSATFYVISYIPYFKLGHNLADLFGLQMQMFGYHDLLRATHPYGSKWWQWPLLGRPISYYYHDFRTGINTSVYGACCVAEIIALPNPSIWWLGLISVPYIAWLAYKERNKGFALLVVAYLLQWLPWIASPRVAFEYHFFPNLAIICIANAALLQRIWRREKWRPAVYGYLALVFACFVYWYPLLAGLKLTYAAWHDRMLTWLVGNDWI